MAWEDRRHWQLSLQAKIPGHPRTRAKSQRDEGIDRAQGVVRDDHAQVFHRALVGDIAALDALVLVDEAIGGMDVAGEFCGNTFCDDAALMIVGIE